MVTQFGVHIKVKDINRSLSFYLKFGFKPNFAFGVKKFLKQFSDKLPKVVEEYNGVSFDISGAMFEIADGHMAVKPEVFRETIRSSKLSAMIHVDSVHAVVETCKKNKYQIIVDPKVFPWGTREVVVRDPDGFILVFIEKLKK